MFQASQEVWDETQEKMAQFVYIPTLSVVPSSYANMLCFIFLPCIERLQFTITEVGFEVGNRSIKGTASQTRPEVVVAVDSNVANKNQGRFLQGIFAIGAAKKVRIKIFRLFFLLLTLIVPQATGFTIVLLMMTGIGITVHA